mmetsp:Transcript_33906/g.86300  ORF Transcript_33906/g.86300 Transcript_33906/m.86300 type:complete len:214 (+) Transcript_33906:87-728(+)
MQLHSGRHPVKEKPGLSRGRSSPCRVRRVSRQLTPWRASHLPPSPWPCPSEPPSGAPVPPSRQPFRRLPGNLPFACCRSGFRCQQQQASPSSALCPAPTRLCRPRRPTRRPRSNQTTCPRRRCAPSARSTPGTKWHRQRWKTRLCRWTSCTSRRSRTRHGTSPGRNSSCPLRWAYCSPCTSLHAARSSKACRRSIARARSKGCPSEAWSTTCN